METIVITDNTTTVLENQFLKRTIPRMFPSLTELGVGPHFYYGLKVNMLVEIFSF